ncbi:hypothetical protein SteCoe_3922 [Stentor coeruleus]|uniref:Uncharacterized protein n=1 Tax=Stentor coeruleus TaxID=5963 RepID=A0A1R2CVS7_9CILI|nr:hypothetical protein SteCoe_3922 [Stentor coeruleus]
MASRSPTLRTQKKPNSHSRSSVILTEAKNYLLKQGKKEFKSLNTLNFIDDPHKDTEGSFCKNDSKGRQQSFMEMMGYHKKIDTNLKSNPLNINISTPTISLTDFMGGNRYTFLKKAGFLSIYDECLRNQEVKKIADEKNAFSMPNIAHYDMIRESTIKGPMHLKSSSSISLLPKVKLQPATTRAKIDSIYKFSKLEHKQIDKLDKILQDCDNLFRENQELRNTENELAANQLLEFSSHRKKKYKLSKKELHTIRLNEQALD